MSPKIGRPPKNGKTRNVNLNIRVSDDEAKLIKECAENLNETRTDVIMKGVHLIKAEIDKQK